MTYCPHGCAEDHITLDLDGRKKPPKVLVMAPGSKLRCAHWRLSSSKRGLHVLVCVADFPSDIRMFMWWRLRNQDDTWRVLSDLYRAYHDPGSGHRYATGIIFDVKGGRKAGAWNRWRGNTGEQRKAAGV